MKPIIVEQVKEDSYNKIKFTFAENEIRIKASPIVWDKYKSRIYNLANQVAEEVYKDFVQTLRGKLSLLEKEDKFCLSLHKGTNKSIIFYKRYIEGKI